MCVCLCLYVYACRYMGKCDTCKHNWKWQWCSLMIMLRPATRTRTTRTTRTRGPSLRQVAIGQCIFVTEKETHVGSQVQVIHAQVDYLRKSEKLALKTRPRSHPAIPIRFNMPDLEDPVWTQDGSNTEPGLRLGSFILPRTCGNEGW